MKRNLTLSLDEELLRKARIACRKKDTSVSQFVRSHLEALVRQDEDYKDGMNRIIDLMKKRPIRVGERTWTRDELHER